jgi:hypothetical protein
MEKKICSKCQIEKEFSDFVKDKNSKTGYKSCCKLCHNLRNKNWNKNNVEKKSLSDKNWRNNNIKNRQIYLKNYKKNNWDKILLQVNTRDKERTKNDIFYNLKKRMRSRIYFFLKKKEIVKKDRTFEIIGCSPQDLKKHLERQFVFNMTWENRAEWHIDHIIPLSSARTVEEFYKLCHFTNLQPLWAEENLKKGNRFNNPN